MTVFLTVACCVICAFGLNALYKHTNHFCNQFVDVRKYWRADGVPCDLQIVNVGSSHPKYAFDHGVTGLRGANLAVGPQTFEYDFAILRKNIDHLSPGAVVVFPICLLSFFLFRQRDRFFHLKYYTFLQPEDIVGYSRKERLWELVFPLFRHPRRLRYLFCDVPKDESLDLTENPMKTEAELEKDADFWIWCWNKQFGIDIPSLEISDKNRQDIRKNILMMKEMADYCRDRGLRPVIAVLPVTRQLSSRLSEDFLKTHCYPYIDEAAQDGTPVLDYLADERFLSPEWYINSFFFNKRGRERFTKTFIDDLKNINQI